MANAPGCLCTQFFSLLASSSPPHGPLPQCFQAACLGAACPGSAHKAPPDPNEKEGIVADGSSSGKRPGSAQISLLSPSKEPTPAGDEVDFPWTGFVQT